MGVRIFCGESRGTGHATVITVSGTKYNSGSIQNTEYAPPVSCNKREMHDSYSYYCVLHYGEREEFGRDRVGPTGGVRGTDEVRRNDEGR
jgi:hypothetical protein